jgi:predicted Rdx family selenoprotein
LKNEFPSADIAMKPSGGGRFEVRRDGVPIFEKSKLGRHAKPGEIISLLKG